MSDVKMKPINDQQLLEYLLTADFNTTSGFSYPELLEFLTKYKMFYRKLHVDKMSQKRELEENERRINLLLDKIKILESKIEYQDKQIKNLKSNLNRKLTFWERIKGTIKI